MDLTQLNILANIYQTNRSNDSFSDLYAEASRLFQPMHRKLTVANGRGDIHDADTYFNDTLLRLSQREDVIDFGLTLSKALRNGRLKIGRNNGRRQKRYGLYVDAEWENDDGSHARPYEVVDEETPEDKVLNTNKETDQRQLIDFLKRSVKTDTTMTSIIEAYETALPSASPNAIAKSLGIHHETVSRKLRILSRSFNTTQFGDIRDIIAV